MYYLTFKEVNPGQIFQFSEQLFIKLREPYVKILGRMYNSIRVGFNQGYLVDFKDDDRCLLRKDIDLM